MVGSEERPANPKPAEGFASKDPVIVVDDTHKFVFLGGRGNP